MSVEIADVTTADLGPVLELNESEVPHVGRIDRRQVEWFADNATYFRVVQVDAELAAFLIGLRPGTEYRSPNYRWFCERYADFAYVDRVAVAENARRLGLASRLYDDFASAMPKSVKLMTCEVNIRPPNEASLCYHQSAGFAQVGSLISASGDKEVAMLVKQL